MAFASAESSSLRSMAARSLSNIACTFWLYACQKSYSRKRRNGMRASHCSTSANRLGLPSTVRTCRLEPEGSADSYGIALYPTRWVR